MQISPDLFGAILGLVYGLGHYMGPSASHISIEPRVGVHLSRIIINAAFWYIALDSIRNANTHCNAVQWTGNEEIKAAAACIQFH